MIAAGLKVRNHHAILFRDVSKTKDIIVGGFSPGVAIKSSAIAATSWGETVDGVQLRVFWQDNHGLLRGYRWSRGWESTGSLNLMPVATRISATNWDNGSSVRVYYQANDGTISEEVTHSLTTTIIQV